MAVTIIYIPTTLVNVRRYNTVLVICDSEIQDIKYLNF